MGLARFIPSRVRDVLDTYSDLPTYNVKAYGASTSSSTNYQAVQDTIDDCFAAGGGFTYLPAMFVVESTVTLKYGVNLIGPGARYHENLNLVPPGVAGLQLASGANCDLLVNDAVHGPLRATASTTLNGTISSGATSAVITSATGFPSAPFVMQFENEQVLVGARSGTSLSSMTRGYNGTTAVGHSNGSAATYGSQHWQRSVIRGVHLDGNHDNNSSGNVLSFSLCWGITLDNVTAVNAKQSNLKCVTVNELNIVSGSSFVVCGSESIHWLGVQDSSVDMSTMAGGGTTTFRLEQDSNGTGCNYNNISGTYFNAASGRGIEVNDGCIANRLIGVRSDQNFTDGIFVAGDYTTIVGAECHSNGFTNSAATVGGIRVSGLASGISISGASCTNGLNPSGFQDYGVYIGNGANDIVVQGQFDGNLSGGYYVDAGATNVTLITNYDALGTLGSAVLVGSGQILGAAISPSGGAGGDLTGTYPNPTIAPSTITNAKVSGTAAIAYSKLDLAASVANSDLATMVTRRVKGRHSSGTGAPEDVTMAQLWADLSGQAGANVDLNNHKFTNALNGSGNADLAAIGQIDTVVDYVEATAGLSPTATTEGTAQTAITASGFTADGTSFYFVEFFSPLCRPDASVAARTLIFVLLEGSSVIHGTWGQMTGPAAVSDGKPIMLRARVQPASGTRTYKVAAYVSAGTGLIQAGAGGSGANAPMSLRVTKMGAL